MTYDEAIAKLECIQTEDMEILEAINIATHLMANKTNKPFIKCMNCGHEYRPEKIFNEYDNDFGCTDYWVICPKCGRRHEWNDCYWR